MNLCTRIPVAIGMIFVLLFSTVAFAVNHRYDVFINGEIDDSVAERAIAVIQTTSAGDVLVIHINSNGGYVDSAIDITNALHHTSATKVISVDGAVASAAVDITLAGDYLVITHYKYFIIHASYVEIGIFKFHRGFDLEKDHQRQMKLYRAYLTPQELSFIFEDWGDLNLSRQTLIDRVNLPSTPLKMMSTKDMVNYTFESKPNRRL